MLLAERGEGGFEAAGLAADENAVVRFSERGSIDGSQKWKGDAVGRYRQDAQARTNCQDGLCGSCRRWQVVALYGECAYDQKDIQAVGYLAHEGR